MSGCLGSGLAGTDGILRERRIVMEIKINRERERRVCKGLGGELEEQEPSALDKLGFVADFRANRCDVFFSSSLTIRSISFMVFSLFFFFVL